MSINLESSNKLASNSKKLKDAKYVVGLGASAGGLEALEHFFDGTPTDTGAAFVVVMHLSRDFKSMLDELLSSHTKMLVKPIIQGEVVQANTVYVIQPATTIAIEKNKFIVHTRPSIEALTSVTTIDDFFRSLANQWKENACGVILSGSGSDGAEGIREIESLGGFTCAQSPETAKFDSMPLSAIATNAVKSIDSPEQLGVIISESMLFASNGDKSFPVSKQMNAFAKILNAVIGISSIDAGKYKHSMFERRVRKRMLHLKIGSLGDFAKLINEDADEAKKLADMLLIGVTEFFRDEIPFGVIEDSIIPSLINAAKDKESKTIKVWVPGCATGQEAYTLGILFAEAAAKEPVHIDVQIFATDLQKDFLAIAARGEYTSQQIGSIPKKMRDKYFSKSEVTSSFVINPKIRKMIVFAPHDILTDPPFTKLDMVSCRNMLIYFSVEAQQKILSGFAFGLHQRGVLFLGSSETVGAQREAFEFIDAKNRIFRRTNARRTPPIFHAPIDRGPRARSRLGLARRSIKNREEALQPAYTALLNEFAPPSLLISDARELMHCFGSARSFLRPPEGVAHYDVADMLDQSIRSPLIAGLERALKDKEPITFTKIKTSEFPEPGLFLDIEVRPLFVDDDTDPVHALVIINDSEFGTQIEQAPNMRIVSVGDLTDERIEKLELELDRTRDALQSTVEQIETTNEELQSSNEELMSSNEELQSTNEELSSVNEELFSVNSEYYRQNNELTRLNNDFDLLLLSTEIGVVFLDNELNITRFTELARDIFNLTDGDIGRPISNFRSPFVDALPDDLMQQAFASEGVVEAEVTDGSGVPWLLRTFAQDDGAGGSILTLINIGRLREAETGSRRANKMLAAIQDASNSFFIDLNPQDLKIERELGFSDYTGLKGNLIGSKINLAKIFEGDQHLFESLTDVIPESPQHSFQARVWNEKSQSYRYLNFLAFHGDHESLHLIGIDVDEFIIAKTKAEEREAILNAALKASPSLVSFVDQDQKYVYVNHGYEEFWSTKVDDIIGKTVKEFLPSDNYKIAAPRIERALAGEGQHFIVDRVSEEGKGSKLSVTYEPVFDSAKKVTGFVADVLDVTKFYDGDKGLTGIRKLLGSAVTHYNYSVYVVDINSLLLKYSNKNGLLRLGYNAEKGLRPGTKITRLSSTWGDKTWKSWLAELKFEQDATKLDVNVFDEDGNSVSADLYASLILHEDALLAVIRVFSDKEKTTVLNDLEQRSQELAVSNRDLEQFASIVAHDLRAPLRHITQFGELVRSDMENGDFDEVQDYLNIIQSSAGKMDEMVDGLLSYSKIGMQSPEFSNVNIKDCVLGAMEFLKDNIKESGADIQIKSSINIEADKVMLMRLFQNLIENSIKYRKDGITPRIVVKTDKTDRTVKITVQDNGIGIGDSGSATIFALFKRLHGNQEYSGLGVGLAACKRIMEQHNGEITLDESYKKGSRFILEFPHERPRP